MRPTFFVKQNEYKKNNTVITKYKFKIFLRMCRHQETINVPFFRRCLSKKPCHCINKRPLSCGL